MSAEPPPVDPLRTARTHPGVAAPGTTGGPTLAGSTLTSEELAGVGAAVAETVADLHAVGVIVGALAPGDVHLEEGARPVITPLAPLRPLAEGDPAADVAALGSLLLDLVDRRATRLRAIARQACHPRPERRPTARELAALLSRNVPGARLPGAAPAAPAPDRRPLPRPARRTRLAGGAVAAAAVVGAAVLGLSSRGNGGSASPDSPHRPPPPPATAPTRAPRPTSPVVDTTAGPPLVDTAAGRFAIGEPGDVVLPLAAAGECGDVPPLAVFRPGTGTVYRFRRWAAPTAEEVAVPVLTVPGATEASTSDRDGDGCAEIEVRGPAGAVVAPPWPDD